MIKYLFIAILILAGSLVSAQEQGCRVKLPAISGSYTGECKKGLANGKGVAQGIDRYDGQFIRGLPDGHGIYTWSDGSYYDGGWKKGLKEGSGKFVRGDSVITGYWKADKYQGNSKAPPFTVNHSRNVARYTFVKSIGPGNGIKIRILLGGRENSEIEDFSLGYSGGSEYRNMATYGIENTPVPLYVTVRYITWNQMHTIQSEVMFEFTLNEPGVWNVTIINM